MSAILSRRFSSPLARWVRRHADLATLFRSSEPPITGSSSPLWVENQVAPTQGLEPAALKSSPLMKQPPAQPPNMRVQAQVESIESDVPKQVPPMANLSGPPPVETVAELLTDSKNTDHEDANWQRLQTIFRKHQEPEAVETSPSPASENSRMESSNESAPRQAKDVSEALLDIPAIVPTNEIASTTPLRKSSEAPAGEIVSADPPNALPPALAHESIQLNRRENRLPLEAVWPVQSNSAGTLSRDEEPASKQESRPGISSVTSDDKPAPAKIAHPVQRSSTAEEISAREHSELPENENLALSSAQHSIGDEDQPDAPPAGTPVRIIESQVVHSLARPPERHIEVLPPSRPRPQTVATAFSAPQASGLADIQLVQRELQSKPAPLEESESQYIETSIGPLPSDLWQLLGKPAPPVKARHRIPESDSDAPPAQPLSAQPTVTRPAQPATNLLPDTLQRQEQPWAAAPHQREESLSTSSSKERKISESEIDLDDLARRVYAEIRRRLCVERERIGK